MHFNALIIYMVYLISSKVFLSGLLLLTQIDKDAHGLGRRAIDMKDR